MKKFAAKTTLALNAVIISAVFVLNYFYQSNGFDFSLKCICSSGFLLLGIINLCCALAAKRSPSAFYLAMFGGLLFAFLGDVLINLNFIIGAALFAAGHLSFAAAYCFLQKFTLRDLIPSGILFFCSLMFLLFFPRLFFDSPIFKSVCIVYALIISLMLGKALSNFIKHPNSLTAVLASASALFFFSDLMLVFERFSNLWNWTDHACMGTYYPALCLLAFAMHLNSAKAFKNTANSKT